MDTRPLYDLDPAGRRPAAVEHRWAWYLRVGVLSLPRPRDPAWTARAFPGIRRAAAMLRRGRWAGRR